MRKGGDRRPDTIVKHEILRRFFEKKDILFVVDRPSVVEMWRSEGLVCLQCNPHEGLV